MKKQIKTSEKSLHLQVCEYLKLQYPNVIFNTDLSGIRLTMGQAVQAKKLRSSNGFPDLVIYENRMDYPALFIELKREGERIYKKDRTPVNEHIAEQIEMIKKLKRRGFMAHIVLGFEQAKELIDWYLT
jgi:hypothetical protein